MSNVKLIAAVLTFNTVPAGGLVAMAFHNQHQRQAEIAVSAVDDGSGESEGAPPIYKLENFVVQLKDRDDDHYLSVDLDLQMRESKDLAMVSRRHGRLQEALLAYFADHNAKEMRSGSGRAHMKRDLLARANQVLGGRCRAVFVSNLIVQ